MIKNGFYLMLVKLGLPEEGRPVSNGIGDLVFREIAGDQGLELLLHLYKY